MTPDDFRKLALALPDVEERSHMAHPDFRVAGKVFATLGYPDADFAMVKLNPEQQHELLSRNPESFLAVKGAWGRKGCTNVRLSAADPVEAERALQLAWRQNQPVAKKRSAGKRPAAKKQ